MASVDELRNYFANHNKGKEYVGHNSKVHTIGWSADGRRLASGSYDKCVTIFVFDNNRDTLVSLKDIFKYSFLVNVAIFLWLKSLCAMNYISIYLNWFPCAEKGLHLQRPQRQCGPAVLAPDPLRSAHLRQWRQNCQDMGCQNTQVCGHHPDQRLVVVIMHWLWTKFISWIILKSIISKDENNTIRRHLIINILFFAGENINITWSPDGNTIAVGNKEDLVSFIDVRAHKIVNDHQFKFEVNELTWNNKNDLFYLTNAQGGQGYVHIYK